MDAHARRRLDERLQKTVVPPRPHRGWVRAIRDALGMSSTVLAERMGVAQQRISAIEQAEVDRKVQLDTLDRAAAAMGCRVEYVLVPVGSTLEGTVASQARRKAQQEIAADDVTMRLEDQQVPSSQRQEMIEERAQELASSRDLWVPSDE